MPSDEIQTAIYQERERYAEEDVEQPTPREINNGLCRMFARRVRGRLSLDVTIETVGFNDGKYSAHAWISHNGYFYDAEVPEGVEKRSHLPHFKRNSVQTIEKEDISTI